MSKLLKKDPKADLRLKYRKTLEASTIVAMIVLIGTFYAFKKFEVGARLPSSVDIKIEVIDIPPTEQIQRPPPPARPSSDSQWMTVNRQSAAGHSLEGV